MSNKSLGRGLKSLIPEDYKDSSGRERVSYIEVDNIIISEHQPRKTINEKTINELAQSIKEYGIIQPLIVSKKSDSGYQLIAGQRRLKAAVKLGFKEVPVIIKEIKPFQEMEIALIENIQREDLNSIEEARGYKALIDNFDLEPAEIAKKVGRGESTIINSIRLLNLDSGVQEALLEGKITSGHARTLITLSKENQLKHLAQIIRLRLTVREAESRIKSYSKVEKEVSDKEEKKDIYLASLEEKIREFLETKVSIQRKGKGGRIVIDYYSKEELAKLAELLTLPKENTQDD